MQVINNKRIAALILAAGYSSRMGMFKPLLPLGKLSVIERAINTFRQGGVEDINVVVGHRAEEIIPLLHKYKVRYIINEDYEKGMFSSVQKGVENLLQDIAGFFVLPVDYPLIKAKTICQLIKAFRDNDYGIIYPCIKGLRGHPPLISAVYRDKIAFGEQLEGLRSILSQNEHDALNVEVNDRGILIDIDTPQDYQRVLELLNSWRTGIPTIDECRRILIDFQVPEMVIEHSVMVAKVAEEIASKLNNHGYKLDLHLLLAAALLHDIAKGKPEHAAQGHRLLTDLGYPGVAIIVGSHMDIELDDACSLTEKEVLYLADKLVQGSRIISLNGRFKKSQERFANEIHILEKIRQKQENAIKISQRIETILETSMEVLLSGSVSI